MGAATVDNLEVQISADAHQAVKSINELSSALGSLRENLIFNTKNLGLNEISKEVKRLTSEMKSLQGMGKVNFSNITKEISKVTKIDGEKLAKVSDGMKSLAAASAILNGTTFDNKNLTSLINSATRLSRVENIDSKKFETLGSSLKKMVDSLAGAKDVSRTTSSIVNSISRLASAGNKTDEAAKALPLLKTNLKGLLSTLSRAPQVTAGTNELVGGISRLASAGNRTKQTADNLNYLAQELKSFIQSLRGVPVVSASTVKLVSAIAQLASAGKNLNGLGTSTGKVFSGGISVLNRFGNAVKKQTGHINGMSKAMAGLKGSTGQTVANIKNFGTQLLGAMGIYLGVYGAVRGIKNAIDFSSSLTEVQNVVDVTFGDMAQKVEDFAKTSREQLGMSELSVKQYASRFQSMGVAMGINGKLVSDANNRLEKLTGGYVGASNSMADVSLNLTKLTSDLASFYDVEQKAVAEDLASIFTGTVTPLRFYGLNLTHATLEEWAHKQGIDAKMKSMSAAEQTMLRYQYVLANTGAAHGDFARTINTWHNQLVLLKENFRELSGVIGGVFINAFKPMIKALNSAMGHIIAFAKTISNALGKIFGWTYEDGGGVGNDVAGGVDSVEDLAGGMDDVADSTDKATKKQKEFNKQLAKFDELTNYTTSEAGGKGSGAGGAGSGSDGADSVGTSTGGAWKKTDSIFKGFESELDTLYKLGNYISGALADVMEGIDWDSIYKKAEKFGEGLAEFLNGLFTGENGKRLFEATGKTIAGALNTTLYSALGFAKKFKWEKFGKNLASGLKAFFKNFKWDLEIKTFNTLANGMLDSVIGALDEISISDLKKVAEKIAELFGKIDVSGISFKVGKIANKLVQDFYTLVSNKDIWKNLGKQIANGINGFLDGMREIDEETLLNGWEALGRSVTSGIDAVLTTIITALDGIHWIEVGQAIADFIKNIDTKRIGWDLGKLGNSLANAFYTLVSKRETWKLLGQKITDGINGFFKSMGQIDPKTGLTGWAALGKSISDTILGFGDMIITALDGVHWEEIGQAIADLIAGIDWGAVIWKLGEVIKSFAEALKKALTGVGVPEPLSNLIVNVGISGWIIKKLSKTALGTAITSKLGTRFAVALMNVGANIKSWIAGAINRSGLIVKIANKIGKVTMTLKNVTAKVVSWLADVTQSVLRKLKSQIAKKANKLSVPLSNVKAKISSILPKVTNEGLGTLKTSVSQQVSATPISNIKLGLEVVGLTVAWNAALDLSEEISKQFDASGIGKNIKAKLGIDSDTFFGDNSFKDFVDNWFGLKPIIEKGGLSKIFFPDEEDGKKYSSGGGKKFEDSSVTVKYNTDTTELEKASKMAEQDHKNTTKFNIRNKELEEAITKAMDDYSNTTFFGTDLTDLDKAIAKAVKDRENETKFKVKAKSLKEKIEEAEQDHENTTKFFADPTVAFVQATKNWKAFKNNKNISTKVNFSVGGNLTKLDSIINNVLIPSSKRFEIVFDTVTKKPSGDKLFPWMAKGTSGLPADTVGVVNDQKGNTYREMIVPPHGNPFIPEGRNVMLPLKKGTKVIPAGKTKRLMENLPHFANGTEDFNSNSKSEGGSGIADSLSKAINDTLIPYIREIIRGLNNGGGTTVSTSGKKTTTKYSDTVKEIQKAWTGLAKWFESTVVEPITKGFTTMKEELSKIFDATNQELTQKYTEASTEWQGVLTEIPGWIKENVNDAITSNFTEFCSGIKKSIGTTWGNIQDVLLPVPEWIESDITSPLKNKFTGIFGDIETSHNAMWGLMSTYASGKVDWIEGITEAAFQRFSYLISEFENKLDALGRDINETESAISLTADKISETKKQLEDVQALADDIKINTGSTEKSSLSKLGEAQFQNMNLTGSFKEIPKKAAQIVQGATETTLSRLEDVIKKSGFGIKRYAAGGFPEDGWFRASHGEIMGQFDNGQSVVANNTQITEGISLAVQAGNQESNMLMRQEINLLQRQNDLLMGILQKETGISRDDVFNAVRESDAMFYKRNHRGAFEH